MADQRRIEIVTGEQARIEGRHTHEGGGARQQGDHIRTVEFLAPDHLRAREKRTMTGNEKPVRVKNRQGVQQHVGIGEAPGVAQRHPVGCEIAM